MSKQANCKTAYTPFKNHLKGPMWENYRAAPTYADKVKREAEVSSMQWVHAVKLYKGYSSKSFEPDALAYLDEISAAIEKKHGPHWLAIVDKRFREVQKNEDAFILNQK